MARRKLLICKRCCNHHAFPGLRESGGTFLGEPTSSYLMWLNILVQFPYGCKNLGSLHRYLHRRVSLWVQTCQHRIPWNRWDMPNSPKWQGLKLASTQDMEGGSVGFVCKCHIPPCPRIPNALYDWYTAVMINRYFYSRYDIFSPISISM